MTQFPIRLDQEIKHVPFALMLEHAAQAAANHGGQSVHVLAARGGLTPEEAVAIIEGRPWERMGVTAATLRLRELVGDWNSLNQYYEFLEDGLAKVGTAMLGDRATILHGRAVHALGLARQMRDGRRVVSKANWNELITALEGVQELSR